MSSQLCAGGGEAGDQGEVTQRCELRLLHLGVVAVDIQRRGVHLVWGAQRGKRQGRGVEEGKCEKSMGSPVQEA